MLFPPPQIRKRAPYGLFCPILDFCQGTSRAKRPTVELKSFAPFFGFWGVGIYVL